MNNKNQQLQDTILIIVDEIDKICKANGISYIMDGGTQLGAVRHQGFIPWDDDFDIGMKRADFDKFLAICKEQLDKKRFYLQTTGNREEYAFEFAKIHLNGTEIIEDFSKDVDVHHGIFVDIFPYDNLPKEGIRRKCFLFHNLLLKNLIWVKCGYGTKKHKTKFNYKIFYLMGRLFSLDFLKSRRHKLVQRYNRIECLECFTCDYPKNILPNKWFDKISRYSFEGRELPGFADSDAFLSILYGDYMKLPPVEQRKIHSRYEVVFGPYDK